MWPDRCGWRLANHAGSSGRCARLILSNVAICDYHVACMSQLCTLRSIQLGWRIRLANYGHHMSCMLLMPPNSRLVGCEVACLCCLAANGFDWLSNLLTMCRAGRQQPTLLDSWCLDLVLSKAGFSETRNTVMMKASLQIIVLTPELQVDLALCNIYGHAYFVITQSEAH